MSHSASHSKKTQALAIWLELLAFTALLALRCWKLHQSALADYDSAKNWMILQDMNQGIFHDLFHHSSPTFYLALLPIAKLSGNFLAVEYTLALCNTFAIWLMVRLFSQAWNVGKWQQIMLFLLVGSSTFLVVSARYLSIESLSLLFFACSLHLYFNYLKGNSKQWWQLCLMLALAFTTNYKIVLFFPILLLIELVSGKKFGEIWKNWLLLFASIIAFIIFYSAIGAVLGVDFLIYAKHLVVQVFIKDTNPEIDLPSFNWDIFFYFKYMRDFENPLILLGLILLLFRLIQKLRKKLFKPDPTSVHAYTKNTPAIYRYFPKLISAQFTSDDAHSATRQKIALILVTLCFVAGMSILAKAPRGLLFAYPLLFSFGYWGIFSLVRRSVFLISIAIIGLSWNIWLLETNIYAFSQTSYPEVAKTLKASQATEVYTSVGLGIAPFLGKDISLHSTFHADSLPNRKKIILLRDDYWKVVQLGRFNKVAGKSLGKWKEVSLCSPILYLEHCEYNNNSYEEAIEAWELAQKQEYHLELLQLK